jgi:2-keto-myo-inositol isomerase
MEVKDFSFRLHRVPSPMSTRRQFLTATTTLAAATACGLALPAGANEEESEAELSKQIRFALNTSTIREHHLTLPEQVDLAAKAGYDSIEPWVRDIDDYQKGGGNLDDVRKRIADLGLEVVSAIGFGRWIVDDEKLRAQGLAEAEKEMGLVKAIGGTRIAAPPIGAHAASDISPPLPVIADRYRTLCELGEKMGIAPQLELWGFSPTLSKLEELAYVVTAAAHPLACVLPDFYHIYKGGNDFESLSKIEASSMYCFHINDYPANPPRETIGDKDRVFPGDGVCELPRIIRRLIDNGFRGTFSLELFNPEYWKRPAEEVAREGLEKSKRVVQAASQV